MLRYVKEGLRAAWRQPFVLVVLFLYRFGWGIALYGLAESVILPLLRRYPGAQVPAQSRLFLAEVQFRLMKTDISHHYLWLLAGLLLARMLITPMLNAGVFYSLRHTEQNAGYRFFRGIRELSLPFAGYYAARLLLLALPLPWVLPRAERAFGTAYGYLSLGKMLLPYLAGMLVYGYLLHLLFLLLQLGRTWNATFPRAVLTAFSSLPLAVGTALLVFGGSLLIATCVFAASFWWAGFWTMVLVQAYRLVQSFFSMWGLTAQQELYVAKTFDR